MGQITSLTGLTYPKYVSILFISLISCKVGNIALNLFN